MILKTKYVDELELEKLAKSSIQDYVKPEDIVCFIPYLEVEIARIKYLKFILVNKKWQTEE